MVGLLSVHQFSLHFYNFSVDSDLIFNYTICCEPVNLDGTPPEMLDRSCRRRRELRNIYLVIAVGLWSVAFPPPTRQGQAAACGGDSSCLRLRKSRNICFDIPPRFAILNAPFLLIFAPKTCVCFCNQRCQTPGRRCFRIV